jgi:hypothetical protein
LVRFVSARLDVKKPALTNAPGTPERTTSPAGVFDPTASGALVQATFCPDTVHEPDPINAASTESPAGTVSISVAEPADGPALEIENPSSPTLPAVTVVGVAEAVKPASIDCTRLTSAFSSLLEAVVVCV